jgi:hypothetical protein
MKKIYLVLIVLIGISVSCTKNFEDFNTDSKHPDMVPGDNLFANAQKALADQVASTNVNLNIWKLIAQYWTETTYRDEANYDIVNRTIADLTFRTYYRDILADLKQARILLADEKPLLEEDIVARENKYYIIDILEVYCYNRLVDIFGNVPYTESLDITNLSPVYDDGLTIYKDLLTRLDADIAGLDAGYGSFGNNDLYYMGDVNMWIKFANTLKVKLGITLADVDETLAKNAVQDGYSGGFSMGEDCHLTYIGGSNSNPLYQDLIQSGRHDFVMANTLVDYMNQLSDPRRPFYMVETDTSSDPSVEKLAYVGGDYGYSSPFSRYSHIASPIQDPTFPIVLLDYTEMAFYLAEAKERGYNVEGTAESWYNSGITSSIMHWGGTQADANAYLATDSVAYTTAPGTWQQKIGMQAWLAYYLRGLVSFTSWRRLDYPVMNLPPTPQTEDGQVPKRFTYPINEQTLNATNYAAASDAIGGDFMKTKLFWDKY